MKAVHFGGGNIGRGFIGLLLSKAGYRVTFVDVNDELVRLLNERGEYTVTLANEEAESKVVSQVSAINGNDKALVAQAVAEADLVTTAVGVTVLPYIADSIAKGIERRLAGSASPLHVIACENAIGASSKLKRLVFEHLPADVREQAAGRIAFPDAAVDRIVPIQQHEDKLKVTVEPFYEWVVDRSAMLEGFHAVEGVHYAEKLQPYIERKLFTVNTGHCCAAYHGYVKGFATIQESMKDSAVLAEIRRALEETGAVLIRQYGFDQAEHEAYISKILDRFRNPYLTDEVVRVGRSPIRKLSPDDRLVRPALAAYDFGMETPHLAKTMAAALLFDYAEDPETAELQQSLRQRGVSQTVARYTGIPDHHPLHRLIVVAYDDIKGMQRQSLRGIGASPGLAIAKAYILNTEEYIPVKEAAAHPKTEALRFREAIGQAKDELEHIRMAAKNKLGAQQAEIFEGHLMILEDPDLIDAVEENIRDNAVNAEYALYEASRTFMEMLAQMDNELLRERAADVRDVCGRIMNKLRGTEQTDISLLTEPCILIAEDLAPSDTARLNLDAIRGFVTEIGSRTSHSAIMARSMDIPAIVGAGAELRRIKSGAPLIMDASEGRLIVNPTPGELAAFQKKKARYDLRKSDLAQWVNRPTVTRDGHRIELAANIGKLEDVQAALDNGAEAIGLFRTEFLYMGRTELPSEEEQFACYRYVLEKMEGKPVVIRTLDIGGDKELPYLNLPKESNPFLGQRALRLCLVRPELFRTQLRALLRASRYGNLKIMFPMITVLDELLNAKRMLEEEKQKLIAEGEKPPNRIEVGMMIEVPAAAVSADLFAKEADFFSIGTNDLIQYTMAADRMNETVSYLYQPCHPAVLRLIRTVIEAARREGKWVGMCGEMAGDEMAIPLLLGLGLDEFSMSAGSILPARELIGRLSQDEWTALAEQAMRLTSQHDILNFVRENKQGGHDA